MRVPFPAARSIAIGARFEFDVVLMSRTIETFPPSDPHTALHHSKPIIAQTNTLTDPRH